MSRYYVHYLNRFISADTIVPDPTNPQTYNRYSYALNNPINLIDPSGHCTENTQSGDEYDVDYECWEYAYQLADTLGISIQVLRLLNLEQLHFFEWALNTLDSIDPGLGLVDQVVDAINESAIAHDLIAYMQTGGWDVIGLRGHVGASGFIGIDIHADILINFSGLELSVLWGPEISAGPQAGLSGGLGVFLGYNAPTNTVFKGMSSGVNLAAINPSCFCGVGIQGEVVGKIPLLSGMIPSHTPNFSNDPYAVAVTLELGQELVVSYGISYSWMPSFLHWEYTP